MRYSVFVVDNNSETEPEAGGGCIIYYRSDLHKFRGLYYRGRNIAPSWRRGVSIKTLRGLDFIQKLPAGTLREIRRSDFREIFTALKAVQSSGESRLMLIDQQNTIRVTGSAAARFIHTVHEFTADEQTYLSGAYDDLRESLSRGHSEQLGLFRDQPPGIARQFRLHSSSFSETVFAGDSFRRLLALSRLLSVKPVYSLPAVTATGRQSGRIRRVLVVTNLAGSELEHISANMSFWNRGIPGLIWKHIYGTPGVEKLKTVIDHKKFDLLIYRGHSKVKNSQITYELCDGDFTLPATMPPFYLHLACIDLLNDDDLTALPFNEGLLPAAYLPDADYSASVQTLIENLKTGQRFSRSGVSFCSSEPAFALFRTGQLNSAINSEGA